VGKRPRVSFRPLTASERRAIRETRLRITRARHGGRRLRAGPRTNGRALGNTPYGVTSAAASPRTWRLQMPRW